MLQVSQVSKLYKHRKNTITAIDHIDFTVNKGEIVALVGESGSGKSTLARLIMTLEKPNKGSIYFNEINIFYPPKAFDYHRKVQMIFQNPDRSLNPRMTVEELIYEPLVINRVPLESKRNKLLNLMEMVKLPISLTKRHPSELSGGQKQRVAIARSLALQPQLLVADEATSSLDAITENQIIHLLRSLNKDIGISILFITHDLDIVRSISDRVGVMQQGRLIEMKRTNNLFNDPKEAYTKELLGAGICTPFKRCREFILND